MAVYATTISDATSTFTDAIDMADNVISNIGAAGTDFTAGGGLTLAGNLTMPEDGFIGIGSGSERFVFDGSAGVIEATDAIFRVEIPNGTNQAFGGRIGATESGALRLGVANPSSNRVFIDLFVDAGGASANSNISFVTVAGGSGAVRAVLDQNGDWDFQGNDLSSVGTITSTKSTSGAHDPPFRAPDGVTYTSYGIVGSTYLVMSPVIQGQLDGGEFILDFSSVAPGSELYRFYWEIDPDTLRAMITPLGNCVITYDYPSVMVLRFYSTSWCTDQNSVFNFQLSANRFDAAEWPSVYGDFGSPEPWWTQDSGEYTLGVANDESLRGIWKPDHPSRPVKELEVLEELE